MWPFSSRKSPRPRHAHRPRPSFRPRVRALEDRMLLNAGSLDPTFGAGAGYVTTALSGASYDQAKQVLVQPSGNIVVAGQTSVTVTTTTKKGTTTTTYPAFGAVEYNPDGSLDTGFGSGGIVRQLFAGTAGANLQSAALEPTGTTGDSKILLGGWDSAQTGMALMRLNANGSLDTTFGSNGQVITYFPESVNNTELAKTVAVTSTGQILVAGQINSGSTVLLARYNANGTLDTTFGSGGTATTANMVNEVVAMALQPDGKFVVVGQQQTGTSAYGPVYQGIVLRYNANGSLDTTFGSGGVVTTAISFGSTPSTTFRGVAVYPNAGAANDGKIIVDGNLNFRTSGNYSVTEWVAVRYNANGSLDSTFGSGAGYVVISDPKFTYPDDAAYAVGIESDGKPILVGGATGPNAPAYSQVARLNVDGSTDATFGNGGLAATAIGTGSQHFNAVAIQPDGKILAAGYALFGTQHEWSLARYLPSEPEIGSFTASANPVTAGSSETLTASNIADSNAGSTVTQVAFYYYDGTGTKQVLGYGTQTSPGVWTLTLTVSLAPGSYTIYAQAEDSYGVFGDPFALALTVQ